MVSLANLNTRESRQDPTFQPLLLATYVQPTDRGLWKWKMQEKGRLVPILWCFRIQVKSRGFRPESHHAPTKKIPKKLSQASASFIIFRPAVDTGGLATM